MCQRELRNIQMCVVEGENDLRDQGRRILRVNGDPPVDLLNFADAVNSRESSFRRGVRVRDPVRLERQRHDVRSN